tara:strand:+ start:552 stop:728 length:177 start_codon:yes stop_codon:yes gene_type:complete
MSFGLVKHNNNSISAITSAGSLAQGKMTLLQTQTASVLHQFLLHLILILHIQFMFLNL